jgi:hypothetical protein
MAALFEWARYMAATSPDLRLLFHVPNGGPRDARTGARLKAQGVKAGVPDVVLPVSRRRAGSGPNGACYGGCYVELKVGRGRLSPAQSGWLVALRAAGNVAAVAQGWVEAAAILERYLAGRCRPDGSLLD